MSHKRCAENVKLSPAQFERIDQVCDRFESSWKAGRRPRIEDYLESTSEPVRSGRLLELLCVELAYRRRRGEVPTLKEYSKRFPSHTQLLADAFREAKESVQPHRGNATSSRPPVRNEETDEQETQQPARLGRYRIIGRLGKGGFGVVYKGYDDGLQREVAIKVQHRHIEAYLAEGQILAKLDHPHIVPVFDVGTDNDSCFIVSKLIEGSDLAKRLKQGRPSWVESAAIVATVAEALHSAHLRGLVHRDIKPGNILLDQSGQAFVADFGLALNEEDLDKKATQAGTAAYMSPELARGEGHRVDGRSDLFSLGVVFYELLTGRRPLAADSREELLDKIAIMEPRPPRQLVDNIPKELERICLKAIRKRAAERYTTGKDMSDDLRYWLAGEQGQTSMRVDTVKQPSADALGLPRPPALATGSTATPSSPISPDSDPHVKVVPKGLRAFDAEDADFFLELLPGPRDRHGLPDSLRFWKTRIEQTDAEKTFPVGLLYGPSGCGKSSLVKAGLLPTLAGHVLAVYIEANRGDTETHLLKALRKNCPYLPAGLGIIETLAALRRGRFIPAGKKVLLVLDQFEQWLQAKTSEEDTELIQALRQCDGERVQCIVMVRDDFWMAATRFMDALEVRLVQGGNTAAVDLFDPRHATKVLTGFGRAFKALPESDRELTKEHKAFLEQAVAGLTQEGKVISVRLALFAETLKGRPWTPAILRQVGGMAGVGVTFLEETFAVSTAPPLHRRHQNAGQAVLKALLPETGTDIKGQMRSRQELLQASGYGNRPKDFEEMLRILDGELRLITPADPEGVAGDGWRVAGEECRRTGERLDHNNPPSSPATRHPPPATCYYQLTHDYLVPSLRSWLTRKQKDTRRGRAELCLAERAALWNAKPENRHLPTWWEWFNIRLFTRQGEWIAAQRTMMCRATRYHALRSAAVAVLLAAALLVGLDIRRQVNETNNATHAAGLVQGLLRAEITQVPDIITNMERYRTWANPLLRQELETAEDSRQKLHASLALLPVDAGQLEFVYERLLNAEPGQVTVLRNALLPYKDDLSRRLWAVMERPERGKEGQLLCAACALASYDPNAPRWDLASTGVVNQLVAENPVYLDVWLKGFRPIKDRLLAPLSVVFRDRKAERGPERSLATVYLADYATDQLEVLADLLLDADAKQFAQLYPRIEVYGERGLRLLQGGLGKEPSRDAKDDAKEKLAKRRANAAVAVLRMGRPESVWPLLRHSQDPRVRSYLIHRFSSLGAQPKHVLKRLEDESDVSIRRALLLILGEFSDRDLPESERESLLPKLLALFREDPDPGLHAAVSWLMRQWGHKEELRQIEQRWAEDKQYREESHERIRGELANATLSPGGGEGRKRGARWFVNSQGQTFAVLPGPAEFQMGSPLSETGRGREEELHLLRIGRTFGLATTQVTVAQFKRCFKNFNHSGMDHCPEPDCPVLGVSWYMAVQYCNWLSMQEGLPQDQWCYRTNKCGKLADGMQLAPNYLERSGYRLPTEAEWEYASRAGAVTSRYYGESEELLEKYAWYVKNSAQRTWPVGTLKPNDFGLFDMHGQVEVWCQDEYMDYGPVQGEESTTMAVAILGAGTAAQLGSPVGQSGFLAVPAALAGRSNTIGDGKPRVLRGGDFNALPVNVRCAYRLGYVPTIRLVDVGFRLARTVLP
jgi:serine/threonine protein kinase/formylglycine-generating enzyme required for sulfatase activity